MNKFSNYFLMMFAVLALGFMTSCGDDDEVGTPGAPVISLSTDDGEHERLGIAIDGGEEDIASGTNQRGARRDHTGRPWYVLQHFEAGDDIVFAGVFRGVILRSDLQVFDAASGLRLVQARNRQRAVGHVDAGNLRTCSKHRFREDAATAADIQHALAGEFAALPDVFEP